MKRTPKNPRSGSEAAIHALTASAMALPGLAGTARAESPVEETTIENEYSYYREDNIRPKKVIFPPNGPAPERDRMEIHSYQFRLSTPMTERSDLDVAGTFETLSGASPWYVLPDDPNDGIDRGGRPVQVMSGATIDENRGDLLGTGNYYFDQGKVSGSLGFSIENDYYSVNLGTGADYSFNDKNTTLSMGVGGSFDWIEPTDCDVFSQRVCSEDKQSVNAYLGITQILTRHSAIQSTVSFGYSDGFLSDPYKLASVAGNIVADSRPDDRMSVTWLTKYRHHVSGLYGTLHLDYKFYGDDWDVSSHTLEMAWYQDLPWGFQFVPSFRYYSQSQADFYDVFYTVARSDGYASSDYRLSPYGAISYGFKLTSDFEFPSGVLWQVAASYERYESSASKAFQDVDIENPGLVNFRVFAGRISLRF